MADNDLWLGIITAAPVSMVAFTQTLSDLLQANDRKGPSGRFKTYWWIVAWVYATPVGAGLLTALAALELAEHWRSGVLTGAALIVFCLVLFGTVSSAVTLRRLSYGPERFGSLFAWWRHANPAAVDDQPAGAAP